MLRQNTNALGIIFPNSYDNTVPELVTERAMASIPFAGRYRMVDFVLSSMANCGISNVSIVVRKNYHSLMDHLGTGREWDMARRHGGLNIVPPFAEKGVRIYSGRVEALGSILSFLEHQKEKYVVMSDANIAVNYDFNALLAAHQASGADVTVAYQKTEIPEGRKNDNYTLTIDSDGRVTELLFNDYRSGVQNLCAGARDPDQAGQGRHRPRSDLLRARYSGTQRQHPEHPCAGVHRLCGSCLRHEELL